MTEKNIIKRNSAQPYISEALHAKAGVLGVPVSASFELTSKCNFSCKMCYIHSDACRKNEKSELTAQQWIEIGRQGAENGLIFLLLTGGEPLIRKDFSQIYCSLKELGLAVSINTNGYFLCDEAQELFSKNPPVRLNVSLYGASNEAYERLCGVRAFDRVLNNIKTMTRHGIQVRLNYSITPYNCHEIKEVYALSRELGLHIKATPYMYPKMRTDAGVIGENDGRLTPELAARYRVVWDALRLERDEFLRRAKAIEQGVAAVEKDCASPPAEGGEMQCRAGRSSLWINSRGQMTACGLIPDGGVDVLEKGYAAAWAAVRCRTGQIRLPAECAVCKYKGYCNVCAAVCYCETGSFDKKPEYVCEMTKHAIHDGLLSTTVYDIVNPDAFSDKNKAYNAFDELNRLHNRENHPN